ncbi:hypothetical protein ACH4GG_27480 [Streptomyces albidoflavus]|uniref:hypothetical protein n=1 Tax=Streptomyces albidoflavus TaxID=1886 RepID=UPI000AC428E1|nr:hypothetical protein [Streptomyces albidoflavus]RZE18367.1 hypothetical protein C0Q96_28725 [Streptomyces albidoflavus]WST10827.1 hypothetical protein OG525_24005 [Streptomyces albidoflavus]
MTARSALHAAVQHASDAAEVEFNQRLDAYAAEVRKEARRELLGDDLNPSTLALHAEAYRYLVGEIEKTMADPNAWDGDEAEEVILARYVRHLAETSPNAEKDSEIEELARSVEYFDAQSKRHRDQRDRARRIAVALEQEVAELTRRLSEIPRTEQCGHDDYHDPHPSADQQNVSCPGHSYEDDE